MIFTLASLRRSRNLLDGHTVRTNQEETTSRLELPPEEVIHTEMVSTLSVVLNRGRTTLLRGVQTGRGRTVRVNSVRETITNLREFAFVLSLSFKTKIDEGFPQILRSIVPQLRLLEP